MKHFCEAIVGFPGLYGNGREFSYTLPKLALYQAELHPELVLNNNIRNVFCQYVYWGEIMRKIKFLLSTILLVALIGGQSAFAAENGYAELKPKITKTIIRPTLVSSEPGETVLDVTIDVSEAGFAEKYDTVKENYVPVFMVDNDNESETLAGFIKDNRVVDAVVLSKNADLIKTFREKHRKINGAVDCTEDSLSETSDLDKIVYKVNSNLAKICVLNAKNADKEIVSYLQKHLITVWLECEGSDRIEMFKAFQSGANGIITENPELFLNTMYFFENDSKSEHVMLRNPLIIGHRGLPSQAIENTLGSAAMAFKNGVDVLELDVRVTNDDVLVVYHDDDLNTITDGSGDVGSHSLKEIKSYHVLKSGAYGEFPNMKSAGIPTLDEYFNAFKDKDVMFFVEIKDQNEKTPKYLADTIRKFGYENRCAIICFFEQQIKRFSAEMPEISVGLLCGVSGADMTTDTLKKTLPQLSGLNSTLNAMGSADKKIVANFAARGITAWPWTYNFGNTAQAYLVGVGGVTTDSCDVVKDYALDVVSSYGNEIGIKPGKSIELKYTIPTRVGTYDKKPELAIIDGAEFIECDGLKITAKGEGEAYVMMRLDTDEKYSIYSEVIKVTVNENAQPPKTDGCASVIGCEFVMPILLIAACFICIKHRKTGIV